MSEVPDREKRVKKVTDEVIDLGVLRDGKRHYSYRGRAAAEYAELVFRGMSPVDAHLLMCAEFPLREATAEERAALRKRGRRGR